MTWRPKPSEGVSIEALHLSPLEAHVLQRLDGEREVERLPEVTGLGQERVEEILARLVQAGAVGAPAAEAAQAAPEAGAAADEPLDQEPQAAPERPEVAGDALALYARELKHLTVDERLLRARGPAGPELSALCFDPSARVIQAVLQNPRSGLAQARLVARHHRDAAGLEALVANPAFARDEVVRGELLKNPQLQVTMVRRLWSQRRALELFKACTSREATEHARATLRELLRTRFAACDAEERVEVIFKTEGRCLPLLPAIPVDGRTVSLLCQRTYTSTHLIQNLARWAVAPPVLLAHLLRQPLVRQNKALRALVLQHPNAPAGGAP
jgi:hypothetical protein